MTTYLAGTDATLTANFFEYGGGPAVDVDTLDITIALIGGSGNAIGPTAVGITHVATGVYAYTWSIPSIQQSGDYGVLWQGMVGPTAVQASETISVANAPAAGSWASVADTLSITGKTVTGTDVAAAQAILESVIHRVWRDTDATRRDYTWLRRAVAWEAAYVNEHPEVLTMMGIQSWSQDGMSFSVPPGGVTGGKVYLAPLAIDALNNLFRGANSTIRFNSAFQSNRQRTIGQMGGSVPWHSV